jgi:hypothetical protein
MLCPGSVVWPIIPDCHSGNPGSKFTINTLYGLMKFPARAFIFGSSGNKNPGPVAQPGRAPDF